MTEVETVIDLATGHIGSIGTLRALIIIMTVIWALMKFPCLQSSAKAEEGSVRDPL